MKMINTKQIAFSRRLDREIEELLDEIRRKAKGEANNKDTGAAKGQDHGGK